MGVPGRDSYRSGRCPGQLSPHFEAGRKLDRRTRHDGRNGIYRGEGFLLCAGAVRPRDRAATGLNSHRHELPAGRARSDGDAALLHQWFYDLDHLCSTNSPANSEVLAGGLCLDVVVVYRGSAIATAVIYTAANRLGFAYVLLGVPILAATFWTYKIYFERVNAKTREAEELSRLHLATVEALATAIDAKDQTTHFHVRRVQIYAEGLGKLLHLPGAEMAALNAGALLHDVGKLAVPDHILNKPGPLTPAEFEKTKIHTVVGRRDSWPRELPLSVSCPSLGTITSAGTAGLSGWPEEEEIPITARIMSVIDCFDSVREDRPFRPGKSRDDAIALLRKEAGTQFDPRHRRAVRRELALLRSRNSSPRPGRSDPYHRPRGPESLAR